VIYIHIPFCRSFCTYCDFYSEVAAKCRNARDREAEQMLWKNFSEAVCEEIRERRTEMTDEVNTLYIGGGTPSVLPPSVFGTLLKALQEAGHGGPFDEFTVEVNPEDIVEKGHGYVEELLELGVNRVSMGVQSFDDGILRWMNRRHDSATARRAYSILEEAGVSDISIDLIFGMPQLSDALWDETLEKALTISPNGNLPKHISAYQLSVEPGSALAGMAGKGLWTEASQEDCARQYSVLCATLAEAGYHHYEISNFALPGHEALHNSAYWDHRPYLGLGPAAHSYMDCPLDGKTHGEGRSSVRQWNSPDLESYIEAARSGNFAKVRECEVLDGDQLALEHIMLALRTSEGISAAYLREHADQKALSRAFEDGRLITLPSGNVRIPESFFFISDSVISAIV